MARDGSGNYSLPANTLAVSGDPISSTKFNSLVQDLESDANVDRPIAAGGTGASTALAALTNLFSGASPGGADKIAFWDQSATAFGWLSLGTGLSFSGTTLALDADLSTLAGLTVVADNFIVGNAGGTAWEVKTPAQARTSLGLGTLATLSTINNSNWSGTDLAVVNGGTGASDAGAARTNLGLAIGTNVQAYDAGLQSISELTTVADRSIYTTASDTYAVYTLTAAGRAILDDADAAAQRTTLGLGTAATVNTGTSGGTVPLLDGTNTWSAAQTFGSSLSLTGSAGTFRLFSFATSGLDRFRIGLENTAESGSNSGSNLGVYSIADDGATTLAAVASVNRATGVIAFSATPTASGSTVWHAGNDGAGSGLDADTLDGVQGSAFAQLSGAAFTGVISITNASATPISISRTGSSGGVGIQYVNTAGSFNIFGAPTGSGTGTLFPSTDNQVDLGTTANSWRNGVFDGIVFAGTIELGNASDTTLSRASAGQIAVEGVQVVTVSNAVTLTNKTLTAPVISTISNTGTLTLPTSTDTLVGRATTDTLTNKTLTSPTINGGALSGTLSGTPTFSGGVTLTTPTINGGTIQSRPQAASETTGTLTAASANKTIQATGDITIPNSVFAAGDIILIYAGDTSRTITQGSGVTMRLGGSATTGSRTLAARGVAMLFFVSASEVVVSGSGVT